MTLRELFDIVRDCREAGDPRADVVLKQAGAAAAWFAVLVEQPRQHLLGAAHSWSIKLEWYER